MKGDKKYQVELEFLEALKVHLEAGNSARGFDYTEEQQELVKEIALLSNKPVIYAANLCEDDFINGISDNRFYQEVCRIAESEHAAVFPICAKLKKKFPIWHKKTRKCFWLN